MYFAAPDHTKQTIIFPATLIYPNTFYMEMQLVKISLIQLSKIYKVAWQESKVAPDNLNISISEKLHHRFFFYCTQKIPHLTFSTLKRLGFGIAMGLPDMYNFHHFWVIWTLLMVLKSAVSSFAIHCGEHPLYYCKPQKILFNMMSHISNLITLGSKVTKEYQLQHRYNWKRCADSKLLDNQSSFNKHQATTKLGIGITVSL